MKKFTSLLAVAAAAFTFVGAPSAQAAVVDTIEANTGFFIPGSAGVFDSPYYRDFG